MCHYAPYNGNEVYVLVTFIWNTDINIESVQEIKLIRVLWMEHIPMICSW